MLRLDADEEAHEDGKWRYESERREITPTLRYPHVERKLQA